MALDELAGIPWTRKHDNPAIPTVSKVPRKVWVHSLEDCIKLCRTRQPHERIRAAGSHWALSEAAISDHIFVETHDPVGRAPAMDRTIYSVIPGCLNPAFEQELANRHPVSFSGTAGNTLDTIYPVHMETGKLVYQAYSEMDCGDEIPESLATRLWKRYHNKDYFGPWGFRTLGGAGGQTVFGALTTGTHGGDFELPPIADSVLAMHLVGDGGKHFWIEPERPQVFGQRMTDRDALIALYGDKRYGAPGMFEVHYDDDLFSAVLVSAGRFGIVYSVVLAAVPQYCLHQQRRITRDDGADITWEDIKSQIHEPSSQLYRHIDDPARTGAANRFLQVAVSMTPGANFTQHLAGVTKRWNCKLVNDTTLADPWPAGRRDRRGDLVGNLPPVANGFRSALTFTNSGTQSTYEPDLVKNGATLPPTFLSRACSNGDFVTGVITSAIQEIQVFIDSHGAVIGATMAAIGVVILVAPGVVLPLVALLAPLAIIVLALAALIAAIALIAVAATTRFGEIMNWVRATLLERIIPEERLAGLFAWQMISYSVFKDQQKTQDFGAISYAIMDGHDYLDRTCNFHVDSIEVFFDVTDPMLVAFVDALHAFEIHQQVTSGAAFVGYASLRFMRPTQALIGMQRRIRPNRPASDIVCGVEVSGLRDVRGTTDLIEYALSLAKNANFQGVLHWGQRHTAERDVTERLFGDSAARPGLALGRWRNALSRLTENGRLGGFSSEFSRRTGLEITLPLIWDFSVTATRRGQPINVKWECKRNPFGTDVSLLVVSPSGTRTRHNGLTLENTKSFTANEAGSWRIVLDLGLGIGPERRTAEGERTVVVV